MVEKVLCHRSATGSLHETWYQAAEAEATAYVKAMLPTWAEGKADREDIARDIAKAIFIDRDREATIAMGSLLRLFQQAPAAEPSEPTPLQGEPLDEFPRVLQPRPARKAWFPKFASNQ